MTAGFMVMVLNKILTFFGAKKGPLWKWRHTWLLKSVFNEQNGKVWTGSMWSRHGPEGFCEDGNETSDSLSLEFLTSFWRTSTQWSYSSYFLYTYENKQNILQNLNMIWRSSVNLETVFNIKHYVNHSICSYACTVTYTWTDTTHFILYWT